MGDQINSSYMLACCVSTNHMLAYRVTANEEGQCQHSEHCDEREFGIGTNDGEPFADTQGQDSGPGYPPDEDEGNHDSENGVCQDAATNLGIRVTIEERGDGDDGRDR